MAERDKLLKSEPVAKQEEPLAIDDTNDDGETQEQLQTAARNGLLRILVQQINSSRARPSEIKFEYRAKVDCTTEEALAYVAQNGQRPYRWRC